MKNKIENLLISVLISVLIIVLSVYAYQCRKSEKTTWKLLLKETKKVKELEDLDSELDNLVIDLDSLNCKLDRHEKLCGKLKKKS